jgi:hypothetical protein
MSFTTQMGEVRAKWRSLDRGGGLNQAKLEQTCEGDRRPPSTIVCFVKSWSIGTALQTGLVIQTNNQNTPIGNDLLSLFILIRWSRCHACASLISQLYDSWCRGFPFDENGVLSPRITGRSRSWPQRFPCQLSHRKRGFVLPHYFLRGMGCRTLLIAYKVRLWPPAHRRTPL